MWWAFTVYGVATAAYQALDWLDRLFFLRPRIIRRRVAGSGYIWGRQRPGDGVTKPYPRRPRSEPVQVFDASEFFRGGEQTPDIADKPTRTVRMAFVMLPGDSELRSGPILRALPPAESFDQGCDDDD